MGIAGSRVSFKSSGVVWTTHWGFTLSELMNWPSGIGYSFQKGTKCQQVIVVGKYGAGVQERQEHALHTDANNTFVYLVKESEPPPYRIGQTDSLQHVRDDTAFFMADILVIGMRSFGVCGATR